MFVISSCKYSYKFWSLNQQSLSSNLLRGVGHNVTVSKRNGITHQLIICIISQWLHRSLYPNAMVLLIKSSFASFHTGCIDHSGCISHNGRISRARFSRMHVNHPVPSADRRDGQRNFSLNDCMCFMNLCINIRAQPKQLLFLGGHSSEAGYSVHQSQWLHQC